jgi:hypothetical protein
MNVVASRLFVLFLWDTAYSLAGGTVMNWTCRPISIFRKERSSPDARMKGDVTVLMMRS